MDLMDSFKDKDTVICSVSLTIITLQPEGIRVNVKSPI